MDETKPLVGNRSNGVAPTDDESRRGRSEKCWKCRSQCLGLVLLAVAAVIFVPSSSEKKQSVIVIPESSAPQQTSVPPGQVLGSGDHDHEPIPPVMYRPFCLTHGSKATARILQTSMGDPSQQWSHRPCYSQPEKVRSWMGLSPTPPNVHLNGFGAPDAILQTNLSVSPFENRSPILGFGAAFTEAASLNYQTLSDKGKEKLMELFFGKSGLGYSLGRVHMNSCDFSVKSYDFDSVDGDFLLEHFDTNVTHDAQKDGMIDMILRATSVFNEEWGKSSDDGSGDVTSSMDGLLQNVCVALVAAGLDETAHVGR